MTSNKKPSQVGALLCIVQVCLLSLASVSPQIHVWVFHGGQLTNSACLEIHSTCSKLPHTPDRHESQPTVPDDKNEFCPVVLFEEGVIITDGPAIQLPEQLAILESIEAEPDAVWTGCVKGKMQARAPPAS